MDQVKQEVLVGEEDAKSTASVAPEAKQSAAPDHNPYSIHQQPTDQATYQTYDSNQLVCQSLPCNRDEFGVAQPMGQLVANDPNAMYSSQHHRPDVAHDYKFEGAIYHNHQVEYANHIGTNSSTTNNNNNNNSSSSTTNNNHNFNEQHPAHVVHSGGSNNNFYLEEQYPSNEYQYQPSAYSQQHRKPISWQQCAPPDCQYSYNYYDTYQFNETHNQGEHEKVGYYSNSDQCAYRQQEALIEPNTPPSTLAMGGDQSDDTQRAQSQRLESDDLSSSYYNLSSMQSVKMNVSSDQLSEYRPDLCKPQELRSSSDPLDSAPLEARLAKTIQPRQQQQQHGKIKQLVSKQSGSKSLGSNSSSQRINECGVCGRNYARPSTLKTHLRTHTNERPFKCNVCSKTFSQAANLTAHQRVHTGERPFSCPICGRQFSQSSSVITHLRTHSGERPYRCTMCSRTFSDSSTLTKHRRIHSGEKPYQCDYCPLNFSQSGNLSRHLKLHLMGANSASSSASSASSNSSMSSLSSS